MKDLEKRLSIIEEKLGIVNLESQFEKKEGKWYKASYKSKYLVYAEKLSGNDVLKGYGFCDSGNWRYFVEGEASLLKTELATKEEIESSLYNESMRRYNIMDEVSIVDSRNVGNCPFEKEGSNFKIRDIQEPNLQIDDEGTFFYIGNLLVFKDGIWAKVIERPTDKFSEPQQSSLEQDIQQLKDKYKQYKFTITIEDNI